VEVERAKRSVSFAQLQDQARAEPPAREFASVLKAGDRTHIIAEVKRRSPSAGLIRPEYDGADFRPEHVAKRYHECGASAISCLTDEKFFGGALNFVRRVREAVPLPVLRKDFIVDPWQVWESRAAGADAILLIAEALEMSELRAMFDLAGELGMGALVEVHDRENLDRAWPIVRCSGHGLLGVNSRDLRTMRVDLSHAVEMARGIEDPSMFVAESGIRTNGDLGTLRKAGVRIALVGEHLMRQSDPGLALRALLEPL